MEREECQRGRKREKDTETYTEKTDRARGTETVSLTHRERQ